MSIALSTIIRPSRILQKLFLGFCLLIVVGVSLVLGNLIGDFSSLSKAAILFIALPSIWFASKQFQAQQHTCCLDISPLGVIRLKMENDGDASVFRLMPSSFLGGYAMLLHLQTEDGVKAEMRIFKDSVPADTFRALSVAFRWITERGEADNVELAPQ